MTQHSLRRRCAVAHEMPADTLQRRITIAGQPLAAIGIHDALSARVAARAGAEALYLGGFSASAALGLADLGLITQTEMAEHVARIRCVCPDLPLTVDADTGFGGPLNAARTAVLYEAAGATAMQIEDQAWPKRPGHVGGKAVIPAADMVAKLAAVLAARRGAGFIIIARTDALAVEGFAGAVERARAYAGAGADALFVEAPRSVDEARAIVDALLPLGLPLVFNAAPTGGGPVLCRSQAATLGFNIILHPVELLLAAFEAVENAAARLTGKESEAAAAPRTGRTSFHALNQLLGVEQAAAAIDAYSERNTP